MNKKEIENALKNYHWMINSIKIMRESIDAEISSKTAIYGLEATLPKPQGVPSDPVFADVVRRAKYWKKIKKYETEVKYIQNRMHRITDDRESEVLYWLLEGKSYRWIGNHMGLSYSHIKRIRDSIVDQLYDGPNDTNGTDGTNDTNETNDTDFGKHRSA